MHEFNHNFSMMCMDISGACCLYVKNRTIKHKAYDKYDATLRRFLSSLTHISHCIADDLDWL